MASIFADGAHGGVVTRDNSGTPTSPEGVLDAYVPGADFSFVNGQPTGIPICNARWSARQLNAIVSEMIALAERWAPEGEWDLHALNNLATAFDAWLSGYNSGMSAALALKAPLASPALTGTPTAPTATVGTNTTQIATTAFVAAAVAALINAAPGALDTLDELAAALGDDANFAATMTSALAGKLAKASNLSDLTSASSARCNGQTRATKKMAKAKGAKRERVK